LGEEKEKEREGEKRKKQEVSGEVGTRGSSEKGEKIAELAPRRLSNERTKRKRKKKPFQFTLNGALLLKVLRGISPFSSSSGTFWRTT